MHRKAVSYISQADALNFLIKERVKRRKTFQASSQEDSQSMRRFFRWEGTKARVVAS